jgi:hypothetical protein
MVGRLPPQLLHRLHRGAPPLVSGRWAVSSTMLWPGDFKLDTRELEGGVAGGSQRTARQKERRVRKLGQDVLLGSDLLGIYWIIANLRERCDLSCLRLRYLCRVQGSYSQWRVPDGRSTAGTTTPSRGQRLDEMREMQELDRARGRLR